MRKLLLVLSFILSSACFASNQGAINNLCQNLTTACDGGDQASCQAKSDTGCKCDASQGTCTRGNSSN